MMFCFLFLQINIINMMLNAFNDLMMKYAIFTCMFVNIISEEIINKKLLEILIVLKTRICI